MIEILLIVVILITTLILLRINFFSALVLALVLSTFLHKELFSIYVWDLLPIRIFMGAFILNSIYEFYIFNKFSLKFLKYIKDPFVILNLGFIISRLISTVNTLNLNSSINLNIFTIAITVFILTLYFKISSEDILILFKKYIFIGFLLCLVTFIQLIVYFKFSFLFGAILNIAGNSVDFPTFSLTKDFFNDSLKLVVMTRVGSLFWDVNHFGGFLAGLVVPLSALLFVMPKGREKNWYLFYFFIINLTLFLTNSRSAWLLAGIAYLIFFIFAAYKKVGKKGIIYSIFGILVVSLILLFMYQDKNSFFREKVRSYFHYRLDSFDSHFLLLQGTVDVFNKFPLIGGGAGSFFEHFKTTESSNEFLRRDPAGLSVRVPAHSIWGETIAETGMVGLSVFILLVLLVLGYYLYAIIHQKDSEDYYLVSSFFATTIGWLVSGIFYSFNSEFFYILFFLPIIYTIKKYKLNLEEVLVYYKNKNLSANLILFLVAIYMIFINLGTNNFIAFDEAIYAKVAKNMYESGDYLTLTWRALDSHWFEKPPLYFILTSFFYSIFGVSEFSARLTTAIFSLICLIYVFKIGKVLKDAVTGYFAVLALLLNVSYLYYSRLAMLDVILTSFISIASYYFLISLQSNRKFDRFLSGIFIGLAVLTKSIVGFLPLIAFGITYLIILLKKQKTILECFKDLSLIFLTSLLVSLPWHLYMFYLYGNDFINTYFGYHLYARFSTEIEDKGGPWYYYLVVIRNTMRAWYLILLPALLYFIYLIKKERYNISKLFILISAIVVLGFFSASSSKLKWYVMPIYPFLSVICGLFISDIKEYLLKKLKSLTAVFLIFFLFIVGNFYYFYRVRDMVYTGNLTYRIVSLIEFNNNLSKKEVYYSYFDKTDYPVALYYSTKEFELSDIGPLKKKFVELKYSGVGQVTVTFITSQSRFRALQNEFPQVSVVTENKDFVLGAILIN